VADLQNGGINVNGNLQVLGNSSLGGDVAVGGNLAATGTLTPTGAISAPSATFATHIKLIPTASPPASPEEGMLYADTDHKLYYYNGTDWKEVAFV
jgi:hypothetical protein